MLQQLGVAAADVQVVEHEHCIERLDRFQEELLAKYGELPDSTPDIREERDRWG